MNEKIAQGLTSAGELNDEPYVNVHDYPNSAVGLQTVTRKVGELIAYVRRIVPGKPVIIAEAGAGDPIHDLRGQPYQRQARWFVGGSSQGPRATSLDPQFRKPCFLAGERPHWPRGDWIVRQIR